MFTFIHVRNHMHEINAFCVSEFRDFLISQAQLDCMLCDMELCRLKLRKQFKGIVSEVLELLHLKVVESRSAPSERCVIVISMKSAARFWQNE